MIQVETSASSFSEEHLLQHLNHYYQAPTSKPLSPLALQILQSPIHKLKYLYNYANAPYNQKSAVTLLFQLYEQKQQAFSEILQNKADFKLLAGRFVGLGSVLSEWLYKEKKVSPSKIQKDCVCIVIENLNKIEDEDDQLYMINKLLVLGYCSLIIESQKICELLLYYSSKVLKKKTIYTCLFFSERQEILKKLIQTELNQSLLGHLFESTEFKPNDAERFIQKILFHKQLFIQCFEQVIVWWIEGVDQYLPRYQIHFRSNLLALLIDTIDDISIYSCQIGMGVERRLLSSENSRNAANMIWKHLGDKMNLPVPEHSGKLFQNQVQQISKEKIEENTQQPVKEQIKQQAKNKVDDDEEEETLDDSLIEGVQPPRNLYDCILGLKNPVRKKITLKVLPRIIRKNPQDLIFSWHDLTQELLYNLSQKSQQALVSMFVTRPGPFIDCVGDIFFTKDCSLYDKVLFIKVIEEGIEELSHRPKEVIEETDGGQFYFKKVSSKYYKESEKPVKTKQPEKVRRWGHTLRQFEKKNSSTVSLNIVSNDPYINRLYEIANHLFFAIVSKLILHSPFLKEPMLTETVLRLLATLAANLKNHFNKYTILSEIVEICLSAVLDMEKKQSKENIKSCKVGVLHVLNKVSLVIDQYIPALMLNCLEECIVKLKKMPEYGVRPVIDMIQANIYTNVVDKK